VTATKTNERPGTRAVHRHAGLSASKARQVLDLIRGEDVQRAAEKHTATEV
jgi:large subunit ribosomal protein L22